MNDPISKRLKEFREIVGNPVDDQLREFRIAIQNNDNELLRKWCIKAVNINKVAKKTNINKVTDCVNLAKCYNDSKFMRFSKYNLIDVNTFLDESFRNYKKKPYNDLANIRNENLNDVIDAIKMNIKNKKSSGTYCSSIDSIQKILVILEK